MSKESFVATATAIGLGVDAVRMPVYFWSEHEGILSNGTSISITTAGVVLGTLLGAKLLKRLPERAFRRTVSALIFLLGAFMLYHGISLQLGRWLGSSCSSFASSFSQTIQRVRAGILRRLFRPVIFDLLIRPFLV